MASKKRTTKPQSAPELEEPALRLEWRSPAELAENPANWRRHPDKQISALTDTISEVGWAGACLYNERTGRLIDGHARRKVAMDQGTEKVPVLIGNWSEEQEKKILATLDPLAAMAEADKDKLDALLREVQTSSEAVAGMLTELAEQSGVVPQLPTPGAGGDDFDAEKAMEGECRVKPGDLWLIDGGKHRLVCGDSTDAATVERLMAGEKAVLLWTDPPYGVNHSGGTKDPRSEKYRNGDKLANDSLDLDSLKAMLVAALLGVPCHPGATAYVAAPAAGPLLLVFMQALNESGLDYRGHVVWVKNSMVFGRSLYHYRHEPILYGWRNDGPHYEDGDRSLDSVLEFDRQQKNEDHPTMKPVALVEVMIRHSSKAADLVYDPFLGSGTTLIAAHRLGRRCFGVELEPKYCEVILRRAEAEGLSVKKDS